MSSVSSSYSCLVAVALFIAACGGSGDGDEQRALDPDQEADSGAVSTSPDVRDARVPVAADAAPHDARGVQVSDAGLQPQDSSVVDAGPPASDGGTPPSLDGGACCTDGNCLCHGPVPAKLTSSAGPFKTDSYALSGAGCVFYPTDAAPPFAAVTIADGYNGTGGCGASQTHLWGPLYASWGIVAMIVDTAASDFPPARGQALLKGIAAFKTENQRGDSPLAGKLSGRYGTSGFSMGGGGTTYASQSDPTLLTSVAIMPWQPVHTGVMVPTLIICGSNDTKAPCAQHGTLAYDGIPNSVPKMRVQITSAHAGQPTAGSGLSGEYGLAFQKVFLEGDQRWRPLLVAAPSEQTNVQ